MCAELVAPLVVFVPGAAEVCGGGGRLVAADEGVESAIILVSKRQKITRVQDRTSEAKIEDETFEAAPEIRRRQKGRTSTVLEIWVKDAF